eukprot:COSAG06_NODE_34807_length_469_cov_0.508108_2_plen_30_part_01
MGLRLWRSADLCVVQQPVKRATREVLRHDC